MVDRLQILVEKVDGCPLCAREGRRRQHIWVEEQHRNITSRPHYKGLRMPFMGVAGFWRVLVESRFLPKSLYFTTERKVWDENDIERVNKALTKSGLYLTNLVKCTGSNADPPDKARIAWGLKILKEEISIIDPKLIITFGQLPFKALTGKNINLSEHYKSVKASKINLYKSIPIGGKRYKVFPTYFPTGRGRPKESIEILKCFRKMFKKSLRNLYAIGLPDQQKAELSGFS